MNVALITSNQLRHKFIANKFNETLNLKLILTENKRTSIEDTSKYTDVLEARYISTHFENRKKSEEFFFSDYVDFPVEVLHCPVEKGKMNSIETLELLKKNKIDIIVLYGSSLIRDILLNEYKNKMLNLHLGLSPYYRGSGTNFFPIVNNEFECLGATIHIATNIVDGGDILFQFRPDDLEDDDTIHSIGNKIIRKAGHIYPIIVKQFYENKINPIKQINLSLYKEYKSSDFNPERLKIALNNLNKGELKKYLNNKPQVDSLKKIIG